MIELIDINSVDIIDRVTKITNPLGIAGLSLAVLLILFRLILKKDIFGRLTRDSTKEVISKIINRVFWLAMLIAILALVAYSLPFVFPNQLTTHHDKKTQIKGNVYLKGIELEDAVVKLREYQKEFETDQYGKFMFDFRNDDSLKEFSLSISHDDANDTTVFLKSTDPLNSIRIDIAPKTYLILSGKVVDSLDRPIGNVKVSSLDSKYFAITNQLGEFTIETQNKPEIMELSFTFQNEENVTVKEFYIDTRKAYIIL